MGRWQRLRKSLKTSDSFHPLSLNGHALRPGGLTLTRSAVDFCGFGKNDLILDAGCGYGATARALCEEYGVISIGMDGSHDMVAKASQGVVAKKCEKRLANCFVQPQFIQARMPLFPFKSDLFDGIFCECVLSLVQDAKLSLKELFRIVKNSGWLVLTDLYIPETFKVSESEAVSPAHGKQNRIPASCPDGAMAISALTEIIKEAGFQIALVEDHTDLLKQMAGQMVFDHGTLEHFWEKLTGNICNNSLSAACRRGDLKPGYCMIIASKRH